MAVDSSHLGGCRRRVPREVEGNKAVRRGQRRRGRGRVLLGDRKHAWQGAADWSGGGGCKGRGQERGWQKSL